MKISNMDKTKEKFLPEVAYDAVELLSRRWVPRAIPDDLPRVSVKANRGHENKVEGVLDRKDDNHPPRHELGFDLVSDPQCRY